MKRQIFILLFIIASIQLLAQNQYDALRFSQQFYGGTARYSAMAGSFGALGGDLSVLSTNPAGIAIYQRSEFSISPLIYYNSTQSTHYGNSFTDNKYAFNIGNGGFVGTFRDDSESNGWKNVNFGITYNRMNDFYQNVLIEGNNPTGSMLDYFCRNSKGIVSDNLPSREFLAYDTYLMNTITNSSPISYNNVLSGIYGETQRKTIQNKGGIGEFAFSFGANYNHLLYIGGTFGVQTLRYETISSYKELNNSKVSDLDYYELKENVTTTGTGMNFKFGVILRPNDMFRVGVAIHTPTFYSLKDDYSYSMDAYYFKPVGEDNQKNYWNASEGPTQFDYDLTTPLRFLGSFAFVFQKIIALNAEYEFVDYSNCRLRSKDYDFKDENQAIQEQFTGASNFKLGMEILLGQFKLRGGWSLYGNPYNSNEKRTNAERTTYSGGFGITSDNYYIDFAYTYTKFNDTHFLYDGYINETAPELKMKTSQFVITFGVKF